ncbi:hypothetical protein J5U18_12705 [Sphingobacteriaceae bacterium WQ 2009]|uniref:Uncharacterized protein n=1 Tax=Rhinopithecimicrobium faecis TaxID=2820698 RepID=A0A8T4HIC4_9SPHI|nr:hypothetical protein [Sphingobacteriaceae bacterium WQ 2009]
MTDIATQVYNWLMAGSDAQVGIRLFAQYGNQNSKVQAVVSNYPDRYLPIIKLALCRCAGISLTSVESKPKSFRDDWPFLRDPACPPELKILVGDKITAYHNYKGAYERIRDCTSVTDQFNNIRYLVENYIENHLIYLELKHYKEYGVILGNHSIFDQFKNIQELRRMPLAQLAIKLKNLEHNLWRNRKKLETEKREDLRLKRENRVRRLEIQRFEMLRILK